MENNKTEKPELATGDENETLPLSKPSELGNVFRHQYTEPNALRLAGKTIKNNTEIRKTRPAPQP